MIVQRFMNWLRMTLAASLGGARRNSPTPHVPEPMLVGAKSQAGSSPQTASGLSLSSWLDNGRRLRPRLRLTPPPRGEAGTSAAPTWPLRHKAQPAPPPAALEIPAPRVQRAPIAAEPAESAPVVPVAQVSGVSGEQGDDLSNLEQLDADTRRLMLLRHLVRRRVFNEGFAGDNIPGQYRMSHGLDTPPPPPQD